MFSNGYALNLLAMAYVVLQSWQILTRKAAMAPPVRYPARTSDQWLRYSATRMMPTRTASERQVRQRVGLVSLVPLVLHTRVIYICRTHKIHIGTVCINAHLSWLFAQQYNTSNIPNVMLIYPCIMPILPLYFYLPCVVTSKHCQKASSISSLHCCRWSRSLLCAA